MYSSRRNLIHEYLAIRGSITPRELAEQARITRQAAAKHLNRLAQTGELFKKGYGRGARYFRAQEDPARRNPYGPQLVDFWLRLQSQVPRVLRVRLADFGVKLRLAEQVLELLERTRQHEFVFVDFDGVDDASDAFLEALVIHWPQEAFWPPMILNANNQLRTRIRRLQERPPPKPPPDDDPLCCS